jgi:hypothetical protein
VPKNDSSILQASAIADSSMISKRSQSSNRLQKYKDQMKQPKTERQQEVKSLDRADSFFKSKSERKKEQTLGTQCELGASFFEKLDMRRCLRCGLNDKI